MDPYVRRLLHVLDLAYQRFDTALPGTRLERGYALVAFCGAVWSSLLGGYDRVRVTSEGVFDPASTIPDVPKSLSNPRGLDGIEYACCVMEQSPLLAELFLSEPDVQPSWIDFVFSPPPAPHSAEELVALGGRIADEIRAQSEGTKFHGLTPLEQHTLIRAMLVRHFATPRNRFFPDGDAEAF